MTAHKLAIRTWRARVRAAPGMAPDWARRMDHAMRGPAARALGEAMEARFQGRTAVVRIDRLRVEFALTDALVQNGDIAGELGRRLADRIGVAMADSAAPGIRVWPDYPAYTAAYALHRLGLQPEPAWAFPDFAALAFLTGPEAAAEVLEAGGAAVLARLVEAQFLPEQLVAQLGERLSARIVAALASTGTLTEPALIRMAPALWLADIVQANSAARSLVALLSDLGDTSRQADAVPAAPPLPELALAAMALFALARRRALGESLAAIRANPHGHAGQTGREAEPSGHALATLAADTLLWSRAAILTAPAARNAKNKRHMSARPVHTRTNDGDAHYPTKGNDVVLRSAYAGLGPLLTLCPLPKAPPETLRAMALCLLPDEDRARAVPEAGFAALFPADPRKQPAPLPRVDPSAWAHQGTLADAPPRPDLAEWADLWLARFASRLPGLQSSSRGYLQREFLCRPGRIEIAGPEAVIRIVLPAFPLGIVLQMSGLTGLTPPVPNLNGRRLLIDLER